MRESGKHGISPCLGESRFLSRGIQDRSEVLVVNAASRTIYLIHRKKTTRESGGKFLG
jgi:hypothetical protein